jgi:replicative DNA helicase
LGKTHLLHAISKRLIKENSQAKVQYVHASNFVSEVVRAFKTKKFDEFKQRYMTLDMLLIEDIQHMADKPGTQQELLYILNSLFESNRQVVMTCNVSPNILTGFDPQLLSLFSGGLTVAIDAPTLEMREDFLIQLFNASKNPVGKEVTTFIAKLVTSNFRELEGAYNRIEAFARFHARTVTLGLVKEALKDIILAQCFTKTKGLDYEQYILGSPEGIIEDCFSSVQELISDAVDQIKVHQTTPNATSGISTCFPSLDNYTSGLQRGDLIVVAGRPCMGERSFVRNIAMHVALAHKLPVAIMENETDGIRMSTRMIAARAKIGSHDLLQGGVCEDELGCFEHAVEALSSAPIYFSSMTPVSVEEMGERLRLLSRRVGSLGLVVVDCLPELRFSDAEMSSETALRNSFTSRYLKLLATELNTPIVVFSPVDRDIEERSNKRPVLKDLSGMAAIANAADLVLIVYRDEVYDADSEDIGTAEILIGKNLHGPIGSLRLKFDGRCGYFEEIIQG